MIAIYDQEKHIRFYNEGNLYISTPNDFTGSIIFWGINELGRYDQIAQAQYVLDQIADAIERGKDALPDAECG